MKLHTKLYLFFAGIVLLPLLVATVASSVVLRRSGTDTYDGRIQSGLAAASAIVSEQARGLAVNLQGAIKDADSGTIVAGDEAGRQATAAAVINAAGAAGLQVRDPGGQVISSAGTINGTTAPLVTASVRLAGPGGDWIVTATKPFDTAALEQIFDSQGIEWAMLSGDTVAAGSIQEGKVVSGLPAQAGPPPSGSQQVPTFTASLDGQSIMTAELPIPPEITDRPISLLAEVPLETVNAASTQALEAGLLVMLGVAVLAATLGLLLTRNITRPLRKLTVATAAGIDGDLGSQVDVTSRDEVGSLANSFSEMQSNIRSYITELEESRTQLLLALSYAGDILGSTTDRDRLIKTTAEAARLATGASGILVELADSESPGQRTIHTGTPAGYFEGDRLSEAGRLAQRVIEGSAAPGERGGKSHENFVVYPLIHDSKALGALVAAFDPDEPLEESKKEILRSLAVQAASAVENVNFGELQKRLAITDPLTGLYNFRYLSGMLERELSKTRRYSRVLSAAILDLDDFKTVNDTYGHQAGDALLKAVARVLMTQVRQADMVVRYGGEEFCIVFPETTKQAALRVAEKLRRAVSFIRLPEYPEVRTTVSIGISAFPEDSEDQTDLLKKADQAMYRAKAAGKNRSLPFR